ncbi:retrovirus-related pol polyprotein from transposon TNT 1-94, partial [Tanacetum coccineum]
EHARALRPLDSDLDSACKFATRIQELLVYVSDTCPSLSKQSKKLIAVTPINKNKKVRFAEPSTSSSNIQKQVDYRKTKDTNTPWFPSTRVISSTSASGSKPLGNTKKNKISRPTCSNKKNKIIDYLRSIKSSLNKKNRVSKPVCNANVKHSVLNANFELICATCNKCMFDAILDLCVIDYLNVVNVRVKTKSFKSKKKKVWKPTGKVFTNVRYSWKLTGRTFTIDGNTCPLTRITSTTVLPPKKPLPTTVVKKTVPKSNNSGKLKDITNIGSSSKSKSVESKISNNSEPKKHWGSNVSTSPSSSRVYFRSFKSSSGTVRFGNDHVAEIKGYGDYKIGNIKFLRSKDETPEIVIKLLKKIQVHLIKTIRNIRTDNGTEFVNQTLKAYYEDAEIFHQTSIARTPQQNAVVERRNRTLVEASRMMLIFSKALLFRWAEVVATACYTQNHSLIQKCHNKTPYELLHDRKPDLMYFYVFGALCYPTNDGEDLSKLKPKADIGIFIGYTPAKKAYRIYNKRTRLIMETIHVEFDELTTIAYEQFGSGPKL